MTRIEVEQRESAILEAFEPYDDEEIVEGYIIRAYVEPEKPDTE